MIDEYRLHEIIAVACHAPSAHNTQPWQLSLRDDAIWLHFDPDRWLNESDPSRRDLWLSLGAFVETFQIAAAERAEQLTFKAEINVARSTVGRFVASSHVYDTPYTSTDITTRRTSRGEYEAGHLGAEDIRSLNGHLGEGWRLGRISSEKIASLTEFADRYVFKDSQWTSDLRRWLRVSRSGDSSFDGLSADCLDMGAVEARLLRALLHPKALAISRLLGLGRMAGYRSRRLLLRPHTVLALIGEAANATQLLDGGRSMMRVWLQLARTGWHAQPLTQLIDCPWTRLNFADLSGCSLGENVFAVLRVGHSSEPPRSLRRKPKDFMLVKETQLNLSPLKSARQMGAVGLVRLNGVEAGRGGP
jgi:hypothetical protein